MPHGLYFAHYLHDRHDPLHQRLIFEFGATGYGLYWMICEHMGDCPSQSMSTDEVTLRMLERSSKVDLATIKEFLAWGLTNGVFQPAEGGISSPVIDERMGNVKKALGVDTLPTGKADPREPEGFAEFWSAYPRKTHESTAKECYRTLLKTVPKEKLIAASEEYGRKCRKDSTPERYTMSPVTFLGPQQRWREHEAREKPRSVPDRRICPCCGDVVLGTSDVCKTCGCPPSSTPEEVAAHKREWISSKTVDIDGWVKKMNDSIHEANKRRAIQ